MKVGIISPFPALRAALIAFLLQSSSFSIAADLSSVNEVGPSLQACPNIWLMHVGHPGEISLTVRRLHRLCADTPILVLVNEARDELEIEAIKSGARGLLSWDSSPKTFLKVVRAVAHGEIWLSNKAARAYLAHHLVPRTTKQQSSLQLTAREAEILAIAASGRRSAEIASQLHISLATVRSHLQVIYRKLGVDNRVAAALAYFSHVQGQPPQRTASSPSLGQTDDAKAAPDGARQSQEG